MFIVIIIIIDSENKMANSRFKRDEKNFKNKLALKYSITILRQAKVGKHKLHSCSTVFAQ